MVTLLAVSGSLRRNSSNTALLQAAVKIAPQEARIRIYDGIGELPHFNPDLDNEQPESVRNWRRAIEAADGLIISTPEYAHGVPGALKNALDWLVGSTEMNDKPVFMFNASPRSAYAVASLKETLRTMGARVLDEADLTVPLLGQNLTVERIAAHEEFSEMLREGLRRVVHTIAR